MAPPATYAQGWTLDRSMPAVDRNVSVSTSCWNDEVPDAVAISEAVALGAVAVDRYEGVVRQRPAGPDPRGRPHLALDGG